MDQTAHNLRQQTELYGEPLGELVRRVAGPLGLTQGALAQVIGLSAPMLSQLMSAQRVKIGNPAVVSRLQALDQLAQRASTGEITPDDIPAELDGIRGATGAFTRSTPTKPARPVAPEAAASTPPSARAVVREIQDLFRAVASAEEIQRAATAIAPDSPALAELLLTYGTGRTAEALTHYEHHHG